MQSGELLWFSVSIDTMCLLLQSIVIIAKQGALPKFAPLALSDRPQRRRHELPLGRTQLEIAAAAGEDNSAVELFFQVCETV